MHIRIYILLLGLCLTCARASAFSYEVHVPMSGVSPAVYTMQSTSTTRLSSSCRASDEVSAFGNTTGRFTTCVYGVGAEAPTHYSAPRPRRVGADGHPEDVNATPIGDMPWLGLTVVLLLYGGYIAYRRRKSYKV